MPTHAETDQFKRDVKNLTAEQRKEFNRDLKKFIEDVTRGEFRSGLRVKGVQGADGVFEMSWAGDGRCTFEYGAEIIPGETHIVWRRCGTHDVLDKP